MLPRRSGRTRRTAILAAAAAFGAKAAGARAPSSVLAFVGTYTPNGGGIHVFRFDLRTGRMAPVGVTHGVRNPSWLCLDPVRRRLFAVSEVDDPATGDAGMVLSYAIGSDGGLTKRGQASSAGADPAHVSLHPSGRFVFVANYGGGSIAVIPVADDGSLGDATDVKAPAADHVAAATPGPTGNFAASDHARPHMHMVASDPAGRFVLAADAGSDRLLIWRFDPVAGRLLPAATAMVAAPAGSAPRHFVFHPNGRRVYVLGEHDSRIGCYRYEPDTGALSQFNTVETLPRGYSASSLGSEVAISPDGGMLYAATRVRDAIAAFSIDRTGGLHQAGETWVEAEYPRSFGLVPGRNWLVSCNQRSDCLTTFRLEANGRWLRFNGQFTPVGSPASIVFL
jgi:6-phosphogluconolactonase